MMGIFQILQSLMIKKRGRDISNSFFSDALYEEVFAVIEHMYNDYILSLCNHYAGN